MRGGLGVIVGLGFDDTAADAVDEQTDADQVAGDIERAAPEEVAIECGVFSRACW
jgi:hypothetical protein